MPKRPSWEVAREQGVSEPTPQARAFREKWNAEYERQRQERIAKKDLDDIAEIMADKAETDAHLVETVRRARQNGHSWTKIGKVLGVSKQAARARFQAKVLDTD